MNEIIDKWWEEERIWMISDHRTVADLAWKAAAPQWQPIETAHKDGGQKMILGWSEAEGTWLLIWDVSSWVEPNEAYKAFYPTHWMPLPKPPES